MGRADVKLSLAGNPPSALCFLLAGAEIRTIREGSGIQFQAWPRRTQDKSKIMIHGLIVTVHILVCFFIIVVVLLQSGKSGDISAAFGGQGSQTAFGPRGAASALSRATTWSAVLFLVTSITLSIYATGHSGPKSVLEGMKSQPVKTQPATPAPVKPAQK